VDDVASDACGNPLIGISSPCTIAHDRDYEELRDLVL
jgi:hypothetical protein